MASSKPSVGGVPLECAICAALPPLPADWPASMTPENHAVEYRPRTPRPVVYGKTRPSARCHTHREADVKAAKARSHDTGVQRTYGVPEGWYAEQYRRQGGKCAMPKCRATGKTKRLAVDHDRKLAVTSSERHPTAHAKDRACRYCVRGLLCGPHNFDLMGKFAVDLEDALAYRDSPPAQAWRWHPEEAA